jgi:aldehyde dehydrogenase (NAD+)
MENTYQLLIDGVERPAVSGRTYGSENPVTREVWATAADADAADVDLAVQAAGRALREGPWGRMLPQQRAALLRNLAELCRSEGPAIARLESVDNGKGLVEQILQWTLIAELFYYWAGIADKLDGRTIAAPIPIPTEGLPIPRCFAYTRRVPVGVVAAITPWNSPCYLLSFKLGPALAAGCTLVVKPSEHTPVSTVAFGRLFEKAGFPPGVVNIVTSSERETGRALVAHPGINKVAFTGSSQTGAEIARAAAASHVRFTAELGGKSPALIFADADLRKAVEGVAAGVFAATGQTCMACSRVIVERPVFEGFVQALAGVAAGLKIGDPTQNGVQIGPLSNRPNYEKVLRYVQLGVEEGATIAYGGGPIDELGGYFFQPTIFTDVRPEMRIYREEIFGPVVAVVPFDSEDEAIRMANDSQFGLAAGVFTENVARAHRVAHELRAGTVWINTYRLVTHMVPFGGFGASGFGREGGIRGIDPYLEEQAIWLPLE